MHRLFTQLRLPADHSIRHASVDVNPPSAGPDRLDPLRRGGPGEEPFVLWCLHYSTCRYGRCNNTIQVPPEPGPSRRLDRSRTTKHPATQSDHRRPHTSPPSGRHWGFQLAADTGPWPPTAETPRRTMAEPESELVRARVHSSHAAVPGVVISGWKRISGMWLLGASRLFWLGPARGRAARMRLSDRLPGVGAFARSQRASRRSLGYALVAVLARCVR